MIIKRMDSKQDEIAELMPEGRKQKAVGGRKRK
jgi:hypothetical protein